MGDRRSDVHVADSRTSLGTVLEDSQARLAGSVEHRQLKEVSLGDLAFKRH